MFHKVIYTSALLCFLLQLGCSKDPEKEILKSNISSEKYAKELLEKGLTAEAADHYARIGEILLVTEGFVYADEMFDSALEIDPNNAKALFYSAILKPLLTLKGVPRKLNGIVEGNSRKSLENFYNQLFKLNYPELISLGYELPDGEGLYASIFEFQRDLREKLLPALENSEKSLAKLENANFSLTLNLAKFWEKRNDFKCHQYEYSYYDQRNERYETYKYWYCHYDKDPMDKYNATIVKLDRHDIKMARGVLAAHVDLLRVGTAYNLKGLDILRKKWQGLTRNQQANPFGFAGTQLIREQKDFLTLADDHRLVEVAGSLPEILTHIIDLSTFQSLLCENPSRSNHLFKSFCLGSRSLDKAKEMLEYVTGPKEHLLGVDSHGDEVFVLVDLTKVLNTPPQDLKDLLPTQFNRHGDPIVFGDPTFGGLFPNGDILEKLRLVRR